MDAEGGREIEAVVRRPSLPLKNKKEPSAVRVTIGLISNYVRWVGR